MVRVLVVDDEENARVGLAKLLGHNGYQAVAVGNGCEALSYLAGHPVDVVLTDIKMPEMNGMLLLRELHEKYPQSQVIMITAYGGIRAYLDAMDLSFLEALNKPFRIEKLKAVISKVLDQRGKPMNSGSAAVS